MDLPVYTLPGFVKKNAGGVETYGQMSVSEQRQDWTEIHRGGEGICPVRGKIVLVPEDCLISDVKQRPSLKATGKGSR